MKKSFFLKVPRNFLLRKHYRFLLIKLGLFSWLVSFCTNFCTLHCLEQQDSLFVLRELGGYNYGNLFGIFRNLDLFIFFFLSNIKNLGYISQVGSLFKVGR